MGDKKDLDHLFHGVCLKCDHEVFKRSNRGPHICPICGCEMRWRWGKAKVVFENGEDPDTKGNGG